MNTETFDFARFHREDDVRALALSAPRKAAVDLPLALQQIQGWQTARRKLPSWAATDGLWYPPHLNMEQCSSEATARYKAELGARLLASEGRSLRFADLTGGLGVDFSFVAQRLQALMPTEATYVERDAHLCHLARHNLPLLGLADAQVVEGDGTQYLHATPHHFDLLYLDPARRDAQGGRTFAVADCTPDASVLAATLRRKARYTLVKLSPMLDWRKAVADLGGAAEVHIVAVAGECKELLVVMGQGDTPHPPVYCDNDGHGVCFDTEQTPDPSVGTLSPQGELEGGFLYEPSAPIMKAGLWVQLAERYGVSAIGPNSHLYVSATPVADFPGRAFRVDAVTTLNKKQLRRTLAGIAQANIAVRNFPLTVAQLRQRLRLRDGGGVYIFATTRAQGDHILLLCHPA